MDLRQNKDTLKPKPDVVAWMAINVLTIKEICIQMLTSPEQVLTERFGELA